MVVHILKHTGMYESCLNSQRNVPVGEVLTTVDYARHAFGTSFCGIGLPHEIIWVSYGALSITTCSFAQVG